MMGAADRIELIYKTTFGVRLHDETFDRFSEALSRVVAPSSSSTSDDLWELRWRKRLNDLHRHVEEASKLSVQSLATHGLSAAAIALTHGGVRVVSDGPLLRCFSNVLVDIDRTGSNLLMLYLMAVITDDQKDAVMGNLEDAVSGFLQEFEAAGRVSTLANTDLLH